jgi:hypothetical protein
VLHLGRKSLQVLKAGADKDAGLGFRPVAHLPFYRGIPIKVNVT